MGCDGGTIPRRDELVRLKKKPEQKDKDSEMAFRWRHCALTQSPLQAPIVTCGLGRLYSKQNVIEFLLEKKMPAMAAHIKSTKDIKDLVLTQNPVFEDTEKQEKTPAIRSAPFICKLIGLEMNGKFRFICLWSCGCVFSERALKEIKSKTCIICQKPYTEDDVVILNGNEGDIELMESKLERRVLQRKAKKKSVQKEKTEASNSEQAEIITAAGVDNVTASTSKTAQNDPEHDVAVVKPGAELSKLAVPLLKQKRPALLQPTEIFSKKLKKPDYSVAQDPKASDVYKSLFTTHKSESEQSRAHWVTYNPFYN